MLSQAEREAIAKELAEAKDAIRAQMAREKQTAHLSEPSVSTSAGNEEHLQNSASIEQGQTPGGASSEDPPEAPHTVSADTSLDKDTRSAPLPASNLAEIQRALALLCEQGQVYEVRALETNKGGIVSGYYDDMGAMARDALRCTQELKAHGAYLTINPCQASTLSRAVNRLREFVKKDTTADANIERRCWLPLDFDPVRAGGTSGIPSTEEEKASAFLTALRVQEFLLEQGFEKPIVVDSGNGAYLLVRIDLPNTKESTELLKRVIEALDMLFGDETVTVDRTMFNAARIIRLPGTLNRKGDHTSERPWRWARIIEAPEEIIATPESALRAIADLLPKVTTQPAQRSSERFDIDSFISKHGIEVVREKPWNGGRGFILRQCVFDSTHRGTSSMILQQPSGALDYCCRHNGCVDRKWQDVREQFEPGYRDRRISMELTLPVPHSNGNTPAVAHPAKARPGMLLVEDYLKMFAERASRPFIWEETLYAGAFNMLVGRPFTGKSSLAAAILRSVALSQTLMGRACRTVRCGYLALERNGAVVAKLLSDWELSKQVLFADEIAAEDAAAFIEAEVKRHSLGFLVIDHLQHSTKIRESSSYSEVSNALMPYQAIARTSGCCILGLHHQGKPQGEDRNREPSNEDPIEVMGSEAYRGAADTLMEATAFHGKYYVRLHTRTGSDLPRMEVAIDFETGELTATDPMVAEVDSARDRILNFLFRANGPKTEAEIRGNVQGNTRALTTGLRQAMREGLVARNGVGGKSDPFRYFIASQGNNPE